MFDVNCKTMQLSLELLFFIQGTDGSRTGSIGYGRLQDREYRVQTALGQGAQGTDGSRTCKLIQERDSHIQEESVTDVCSQACELLNLFEYVCRDYSTFLYIFKQKYMFLCDKLIVIQLGDPTSIDQSAIHKQCNDFL